MQLQSLQDVFAEQVADLHSAERQLVDALKLLTKIATGGMLRTGVNEEARSA